MAADDAPPEQCALCRLRPTTATGEHVLPRGILKKLFPVEKGPYTTTERGTTRVTQQFDSIKLPCCLPCNDVLNSRFEQSGQEPALRLFTQETPELTAAETAAAALWVLKTWLLMAHPRSRYQLGTPRPDRWDDAPDSTWSWLVDGRPPPDGLSAWVFRHVQDNNAAETGPTPVVALPTVVADGTSVRFRVLDLTLALTNVVVVFHPGWPVEHPAEATGGAVRLWPRTGAPLPTLPKGTSRPVRFANGPELRFSPGTYRPPLPPLRAGTAPETLVLDVLDGGQAPW
jgi:hypothetical protein